VPEGRPDVGPRRGHPPADRDQRVSFFVRDSELVIHVARGLAIADARCRSPPYEDHDLRVIARPPEIVVSVVAREDRKAAGAAIRAASVGRHLSDFRPSRPHRCRGGGIHGRWFMRIPPHCPSPALSSVRSTRTVRSPTSASRSSLLSGQMSVGATRGTNLSGDPSDIRSSPPVSRLPSAIRTLPGAESARACARRRHSAGRAAVPSCLGSLGLTSGMMPRVAAESRRRLASGSCARRRPGAPYLPARLRGRGGSRRLPWTK
jgi:hypothetical protein